MLAATAGELNPIATGIAYCAVILECVALFDLQARLRMDGRTQRLVRRPAGLGAVPRAVSGAPVAAAAGGGRLAERSRERSWRVPAARRSCRTRRSVWRTTNAVKSAACKGTFDAAEQCYRDASRHGYHPVPGLALLEMAKGDAAAARATIRRALAEGGSSASRSGAAVCRRRNQPCRSAISPLRGRQPTSCRRSQSRSASELLAAMAAQATGSVLMASGDATPPCLC